MYDHVDKHNVNTIENQNKRRQGDAQLWHDLRTIA